MSPAETVPEGNQLIAELLAQLDIRRLVVVDDIFDRALDEDFKAEALADIPRFRDNLRSLLARRSSDWGLLDDGQLVEDNDEVRQVLRDHWQDLSAAELAVIKSWYKDPSDPADKLASVQGLVGLPALIPAEVEYRPMTVASWREKSATLFGEDSPPTLVFFDRDFGDLGGTHGGDQLLRELLAQGHDDVHCGLFTHDAPTVEREIEIAEQVQEPGAQVVSVLGKRRVEDATLLAEGLRVFLHTRDLSTLKQHAADVLTRAVGDAQQYLASIGYYAIMASAEAARSEGQFENDGLFRIAEAKLRRQLVVRFREDPPLTAIARIRAAAKTKIVPYSPSASAYEWAERFDSKEFLAQSNRPLELGDIFKVTDTVGESRFYMLLMQPCDLMVRSDGTRSNKQSHFTLAEVRRMEPEQSGEDGRWVRIGRLVEGEASMWGVDMAKRLSIPTQFLDACVLDPDGRAVLRPAFDVDPAASQGWSRVPSKLVSWRKDRIGAAAALTKLLPKGFEGRESVRHALQMGVLGPEFVSGQIAATMNENKGVIDAQIERDCRLVESHARAVLQRWAAYLARPDSPGDLFGRESA